MFKMLLALLLCLPGLKAVAAVGEFNSSNSSDSDRLLKQAESRSKHWSHEQIARDIDETMELVEALARQMKLATKEEVADVWASGPRDYKLDKGEVKDSRRACESTLKALAIESGDTVMAQDAEIAKELRSEARDYMRDYHKKKSEAYLRDLRNWLTISEGVLRRANESREIKK